MQPFVKWIGGKGQLLAPLRQAVPQSFHRYIEPMVGGGALFFDLARRGQLAGREVILADTNEWLMRSYEIIRDAPEDLLEVLAQLRAEYDKAPSAFFYDVRQAWNEGRRDSARFIFLKQTSFNGLWRFNRKGNLNMPWGKYAHPRLGDRESLMACSRALQGVELRHQHYREVIAEAQAGDVVYFDPPYFGTFDSYAATSFTGVEHVNLVHACNDLTGRGVHVIYTHQNGPEVWRWLDGLWPYAEVRDVHPRRYVNRSGKGRGRVVDLLVTSSEHLRPPHTAPQAA